MSFSGEKSCSVCLSDKIRDFDYVSVIMPCLHTMCSPCMSEFLSRDIRKCHICRGEIEGVIDSVGGEEDEEDDVILVLDKWFSDSQTIDLTMD